jgi:hypothetical protein
MTVSSVGGSGNQFLSLASDSIAEGSFTSVSGELAVLMLNTQEKQKQAEQQQLDSARHEYTEALSHEVEALKAEADAAFRGACVEGSLAIAAGAAGVWGAARTGDHPWQSSLSDSLGKLAHPLGTAISKNYGAADAKSAEGAEQAAKWQIDDAHDAVKDGNTIQNKALDWASSMSDHDAATTAAILSNKV